MKGLKIRKQKVTEVKQNPSQYAFKVMLVRIAAEVRDMSRTVY